MYVGGNRSPWRKPEPLEETYAVRESIGVGLTGNREIGPLGFERCNFCAPGWMLCTQLFQCLDRIILHLLVKVSFPDLLSPLLFSGRSCTTKEIEYASQWWPGGGSITHTTPTCTEETDSAWCRQCRGIHRRGCSFICQKGKIYFFWCLIAFQGLQI
jgi:hypothetical protein